MKTRKYTVEELLLLAEREQARIGKEPTRALEQFRYRDPAMSIKLKDDKRRKG